MLSICAYCLFPISLIDKKPGIQIFSYTKVILALYAVNIVSYHPVIPKFLLFLHRNTFSSPLWLFFGSKF